ncbi:hypothetical protein Ahy_B08g092348 [Arachis hypogaea]|uniref:AAA-type ATPase N-terminal domain-containing protein n=1 Tax=Arachis hypogaea TaxID=3818 RepID=A0A444Y3S3_ARAHY|nr:hypothetical protein Ahy_B08g092348 [Arachis hypogaea]
MISTVASIAATAMLIRSIAHDFIPHEILDFFSSQIHGIRLHFSSQFTIVIEEFHGVTRNQAYEAAEAYLGSKGTLSALKVKAGKSKDHKKLLFFVDKNQEVCDEFEGIKVRWRVCCEFVESSGNGYGNRSYINASLRSEVRSYELSFHKKHKEKILNSYLPYVLDRGKAIKEGNLAVKLHTGEHRNWNGDAFKFGHPMTFKTLTIEAELKKEIMEDLDKFLNGKEF